ncbi:MAG TPA: DUF58 domain-containing protein [Actinomycetes bacterium]|nr:DUF58 domain-containing protein [Actinomycetes bacterium]
MRAAMAGLTTRGRALLAAGITASLMALVSGQRDILRVGILVALLPLLAALSVARTRFRLSCRRMVRPSRVPAGEEGEVTLKLENVASLPTGLLLVEDQAPATLGSRPRFVVDRLPPRSTREVRYPVRSDVRGRYLVGPLSVRLADPFGLCGLDRTFSSQDLFVVTPTIEELPAIPLSGDWSGSGDSRARSVAAAGEDDVAVREYRHGDELRRVHWRATAKMGSLMVRREEQPWESRATLLLDLRASAHRGRAPDSTFERLVSGAASVGTHLGRRGYSVRLVSGAGLDVASAAHEPGSVPADNEGLLLDALAVVEERSDIDVHALAAAIRHAPDGLLVVALGAVTRGDADQLIRARHGMGNTIALTASPAGWVSASGPDHARLAHQATEAQSLLRIAGWRVVPVERGVPLARNWPLAGRVGADAPRGAA